MNDLLDRLLSFAAGEEDPDLGRELRRPGSPASHLADEIDRLNAKEIDLARVPGLEAIVAAERQLQPPAPAADGLTARPGESPAPRPAIPARSWFGLRDHRRAVAAAALVILLLGGASGAAWVFFVPKPLLQDSLDRPWFNADLWHSTRPVVRAETGYLSLLNRGAFRSQQEFSEPIDLRFEWRFRDLAGYPHYAENFAVALRTSGRHAQTHPFDVENGVVVSFMTYPGRVHLSVPAEKAMLAITQEAAFRFVADEWYTIRVTDDGESVSVYVQGPEIDPKYGSEPALRVHCPAKGGGAHVGFFNRELVANVPHESHLRNVTIWNLPAKQE